MCSRRMVATSVGMPWTARKAGELVDRLAVALDGVRGEVFSAQVAGEAAGVGQDIAVG